MHSYTCYGLSIRSTLRLPELERAGSREHGAQDCGLRISDFGFREEPRAESREEGGKAQRVKSKGRRGQSREQGAGSGELRISDFRLRISDLGNSLREQGARSLEQESKGQRAGSKELGAQSLEGAPDVEIRFGRVERLPAGVTVEGSYFRLSPEETQLFWGDVGTIRVRGGREITIDPLRGVEEGLLRLFILGPVLGALLQQRGQLVLHASSVAMPDGAVAFVGEKGWGKSSVAGTLYFRGHGIVSDDVTAVHVGTKCPRVLPGFPQLKLWPDTAVSLGEALERLPRLHSQLDKRVCRVSRGFPEAPLPLKAIYVLAQGETPRLEPLARGKAFVELVRHSYRSELLQSSGASAHFLQCASIAKSTSIRYLRIPRSLSILPDVARLVEEDIVHNRSEHTTLAS